MSDEYPDWQDGMLKVVYNDQGICSIWPAERSNALGWYDLGFTGQKAESLSHIEKVCDLNCVLKVMPVRDENPS
ncbi:MAG: MbtH family NRPS accessory protein [Planctomycetales bacterium]|nr:MbtH family NRPS accessory protein [Planctomycetales bacterium]